MAIIRESVDKFQVIALAEQNGVVYYSVKSADNDELELFTYKELEFLNSLRYTMYDSDMKPIKFDNGTIIGNIEDVTNILYAEEVDDTDGEVDDFFAAYEDEEVDDEYSDENVISEDEDLSDYDDYSEYDEEVDDDTFTEEPDEIDDFFAAYEEEEEEASTVSKLYEFLTEEQIKIVKRYYLWFSQRLFTEAQKDPTFGIKSKRILANKIQDLNNLREQGVLWHYAGFVDMGYKGAGYCTLGHPLRFMHVAWDITASDLETGLFGQDYNNDIEEIIQNNNCIVFGVKCIGDFFEVDKECTDNLQKAQRTAIKDMDIMVELYEAGKANEVISSFTEMDKVMNKIKLADAKGLMMSKDYQSILPSGLTALYLQFREAGIVLPKSMIQEIRSHIVGWFTNKQRWTYSKFGHMIRYPNKDVFEYNLELILGKKIKNAICTFSQIDTYSSWGTILDSRVVGAYLYVYFTYEICGWYKYDADKNKDEGGYSQQSKAALASCYDACNTKNLGLTYTFEDIIKICQLYSKLKDLELLKLKTINRTVTFFKAYFGEDVDNDLIKAMRLNYNKRPEDAEVCATDKEIFTALRVANRTDLCDFLMHYDSLKQSSRRYYSKYNTYEVNFEAIYNAFVVSDLTKVLMIFIEDTSKNIIEKCESLIPRMQELINQEEEEKRKAEEARLAEEKRKAEELEAQKSNIDTPEKMVAFLKDADLSSVSDKEFGFHKSVLNTVLKSGKSPSAKQAVYVQKLYEAVSGVGYTGSSTVIEKVDISDDTLVAIKYVIEHQSDFDIDSKTLAIITTVFKTKKASERQMKYVRVAEELYRGV